MSTRATLAGAKFNHTAPCAVKRAGIVDIVGDGHLTNLPIIDDSSAILMKRAGHVKKMATKRQPRIVP